MYSLNLLLPFFPTLGKNKIPCLIIFLPLLSVYFFNANLSISAQTSLFLSLTIFSSRFFVWFYFGFLKLPGESTGSRISPSSRTSSKPHPTPIPCAPLTLRVEEVSAAHPQELALLGSRYLGSTPSLA